MPGIESLINGDIKSKRKMTATYLKGFYNSTFFPDRRNGHFAADAIISNPPAFAHIHVAQAMGIPLHMSFSEYASVWYTDRSHAVDTDDTIPAPTGHDQRVERRTGHSESRVFHNGRRDVSSGLGSHN